MAPIRTNDTQFQLWMREVDAALVASCGMVSADLPDCCYYDWFNDRVSPRGAARRAQKAAA